MKKEILYIWAVLGMFIACGANETNRTKMEEKYEWLGSLSAPNEYPVEIYDGALVSSDYSYGFGPIWGVICVEWGEAGGIMSVESGPVDLPEALRMTWYSIAEKKFYTGSWSLDTEKIAEVWKEGAVNVRTKQVKPFTTFVVGLAPAGKVVLWASNSSRQVQLAAFQARDTIIHAEQAKEDFAYFFRPDYQEKVLTNEALYDPALLSKLKSRGWPDPELYQIYENSYQWRFTVNGLNEHNPDYFYYACFNGNRDMILAPDTNSESGPRPIPKHIYTAWKDPSGKKWVADLEFDFDQVNTIYSQIDQSEPVRLEFDIDTAAAKVRSYLISSSKRVELPSTKQTVVKD